MSSPFALGLGTASDTAVGGAYVHEVEITCLAQAHPYFGVDVPGATGAPRNVRSADGAKRSGRNKYKPKPGGRIEVGDRFEAADGVFTVDFWRPASTALALIMSGSAAAAELGS